MSVGLQRLREDADAIRKGATDKGEDPAIVDQAIAADERRRQLLGDGDTLKAERNAASKEIGNAIKGGAKPDGPEVAELRRRSVEAGERIAAIDKELADVEAQVEDLMLRIPNPADPEVPIGGEEANVTVRTWGEQLPWSSRSRARSARTHPRAARRGAGSPTGRSPRRSTSSTCRAARRSPAPAFPSTRAPGRGSSGR